MIAQWSDVTAAVWLAGFFALGAWVGRVFRHGVRLTVAGVLYGASWRLERASEWLIDSQVRAAARRRARRGEIAPIGWGRGR